MNLMKLCPDPFNRRISDLVDLGRAGAIMSRATASRAPSQMRNSTKGSARVSTVALQSLVRDCNSSELLERLIPGLSRGGYSPASRRPTRQHGTGVPLPDTVAGQRRRDDAGFINATDYL